MKKAKWASLLCGLLALFWSQIEGRTIRQKVLNLQKLDKNSYIECILIPAFRGHGAQLGGFGTKWSANAYSEISI